MSRGHRYRGGTNKHFMHVGPLPGIEVSFHSATFPQHGPFSLHTMFEDPTPHKVGCPSPFVRPLDDSQGASPFRGHGPWFSVKWPLGAMYCLIHVLHILCIFVHLQKSMNIETRIKSYYNFTMLAWIKSSRWMNICIGDAHRPTNMDVKVLRRPQPGRIGRPRWEKGC